MKTNSYTQKLHLLNRCGFGISPQQWMNLQKWDLKELLSQVENNAKSSFSPFIIVKENIDKAYKRDNNIVMITAAQRGEINRQDVTKLRELSIEWMNSMLKDQNQLREKMALFWHGHFACRMNNSFFQQTMLNSVRQHALENFGDLLKETSKSAAMLNFLNNQQNKKAHPNENFAREVMELFTLGRGNYTETDIKEAARAFTGWTYDADGNFQFNKKVHDAGVKKVLGVTGNLDGDQVLDILLKNKKTADFITTKIYKYVVNDTPNQHHIKWLSARFYSSNYNISALLHDIFTASWFYKNDNIGAIIKSPVDLLVNIQRTLPMQVQNPATLLIFNNALGQQPFYPPNVAGWPGGASWIDSSSLMLRLKIPQLIEENQVFHITTKEDDDIQMGQKTMGMDSVTVQSGKRPDKLQLRAGNHIEATIDWEILDNALAQVKDTDLFRTVTALVLGPVSEGKQAAIIENKVPLISDRKKYIKNLMLALMSTPEFQLS